MGRLPTGIGSDSSGSAEVFSRVSFASGSRLQACDTADRRFALRAGRYVLLAFSISIGTVSAHPGHSWSEHGTAHLLTSSFHLGTFAVVALTFAVAARLTRSRRLRRCLHAGAALSIVAGAAWFFGR